MDSNKRKVLVMGAGIGGIRSALDLAESGCSVVLIDHAPVFPGMLSRLDHQFPSNGCGMCKMLPMSGGESVSQFCLRKGLFHENIEFCPSTTLESVSGEAGNFEVSLHRIAGLVDPDRCVGCGLCADVCPVEIPDPFNEGMSSCKAIHAPAPHKIPDAWIIDTNACTRCGECEKICPVNAIRLSGQGRGEFKILVVDDELVVRDSLKELLSDEGFEVEMAESGAKALEMLEAENFHLMLTDIKMPGMDGVTLLQKAKEARPDLCVMMMTAYATVETAVDAMKIGARDYLMKPFEPDVLLDKISAVHGALVSAMDRRLTVGAIILNTGCNYFDPGTGKNVFSYGINPHVLTNLEFERLLSGTGPTGGRLVRPADGRPVKKIAWLQCVGSRDIQADADYCSSICCMIAIKEAVLAHEKSPEPMETAIFYMDMRTPGKSFHRCREEAQNLHGVRFIRTKIHSISPCGKNQSPALRYMDSDGQAREENFDLVVLSVGQRPSEGTSRIAETLGIETDARGFFETLPHSGCLTAKKGILIGGSAAGFKDISESVMNASAAAAEARLAIRAAGAEIMADETDTFKWQNVGNEEPAVLVVLCGCGERLARLFDVKALTDELASEPGVKKVTVLPELCSVSGWESLMEIAENSNANRVLIGACHPNGFIEGLRELSRRTGLLPALLEVVDLGIFSRTCERAVSDTTLEKGGGVEPRYPLSRLRMGLARLKNQDPGEVDPVPVTRRALVIGGGIAGMTAALAMADMGFPVDLVEKEKNLGGNLTWLHRSANGADFTALLNRTVSDVEKHPEITVHLDTQITDAFGEVGAFFTSLQKSDGKPETLNHGAVILATGGKEAETQSYCHGKHPGVLTRMEFEKKLAEKSIDPAGLTSVVMIQCVDSREEPRNYCSRVCCVSALGTALMLKEKNPDIMIFILYRDMMAYGLNEALFTRARQAGVIFIPYDLEQKPEVGIGEENTLVVRHHDPVLRRLVEITPDLVLLSTGVVSNLPALLAGKYGAKPDTDGFFQEAESKWRPVESLKEGVFACGLSHSPRSVDESMVTAKAAAQGALAILSKKFLPAGRVVAKVRHSLCSLCLRCIETCPYEARHVDPEDGKIVVNPAICQGCGACAAVCPNKASVVAGFEPRQMMAVIDEAFC